MAGVTADAVDAFMRNGSGSGYGSGDGDGSGSGDGSGYGYGSGDGYGYGSGDGSGYGSGYGYGSGDGDGSGSGDGSGDGSGYGYGSGDGYGYGYEYDNITSYCGDAVYKIDYVQTILRSIHGNAAMGDILRGDLTLEKCYVVKGGGCFAHGATLREAQAALERKIMDNMPVEDKIAKFMERFHPGQQYSAKEFYEWHNTLTGSCEMGRNEFAKAHSIDVEHDTMTPEEFVRLTENAYGGAIIKRLKAAMEAANEKG